jgi:CHAT domain-containing protein
MHAFPLAALRIDDRYLIERFALSYRARFTELSNGARRPETNGLPGRVLGVAVTRELPGGFRELPQARAEAENVARWGRDRGLDADVLIDERAGRAAVLERLSGASVAHFSCHGVSSPSRFDAWGLLLNPRADAVEVLSIRDLARQDLRRLHHVTLSACWSADVCALPGRWVISLPEAILRAGAESVLACLWEAEARISCLFSTCFYHGLAQGLPRDEALRQAQLACLENRLGDGSDTTSPYSWALFRLHGAPGPISV